MSASLETTYRNLLEAVSFAARAHRHQLRKDGHTPYAGHVFRVCLIVRHIFGITDPKALMAAALHDTIEDTTTDFDDLEERFGREVAELAAALCKDTRLPEKEREEAYIAQLVRAPWQVKVCKLADIFDNLMDARHVQPDQAARTRRRCRQYLNALAPHLPEEARKPYQIVEQLHAELSQGAPGP
jgi:guanosine-3',5'-bis(diphosphate) 3'-pyrophosphohydrolase